MKTVILLLSLILPNCIFSQQVPDLSYSPKIDNPTYPYGTGPLIFIDEGHNNFHTKEGRYKPFSLVLERDGYIVKGYQGTFNRKDIDAGKILVIANATQLKLVSLSLASIQVKENIL